MKSKVLSALVEQLMMVLIFSLVALSYVKIFVLANEISINNQNRDKAVGVVQSAAELLLAGEDVEDVYYNGDWGIAEGSYTYHLKVTPIEIGGLEAVSVELEDKNGVLFGVEVMVTGE